MSTPTRKSRIQRKSQKQHKNFYSSPQNQTLWLWGRHSCQAALENPKRKIYEIFITETAAIQFRGIEIRTEVKIVPAAFFEQVLPYGTTHQGIALRTAPLIWPAIENLAENPAPNASMLVLDQLTDPHNVGAMIRLASAFGVRALIMQTRHAPPLSGACAKVAVGCLESVPVCLVTNIANCLSGLKKQGWFVTGLAGEAAQPLKMALKPCVPHVLVVGAEDTGLRPRIRAHCDTLAHIPMVHQTQTGTAESLNAATATAIALYEHSRTHKV